MGEEKSSAPEFLGAGARLEALDERGEEGIMILIGTLGPFFFFLYFR